ncbi:MAG TPA: helix-turn-helix transcriptional regulator [Chitinophagaceae bacterium]|jgi:AraC-like DNA-binding protein/mannose-6-phosphate isomerase-like protein (cupin superfamily)|nr:helix-turn-helix transcriptional regulator [Chitinophagaceae bacterium]
MKKNKIPVYDNCSIGNAGEDFYINRFADYLAKHYHSLHWPHRHSFFHLVFFVKGSGSHTIDFSRYDVKPNQVYFMIPGQVHSWDFKGQTDGYIINFSDHFLKSFLLRPDYLERFHFFRGISDESICQLPGNTQAAVKERFESLLKFYTAGHNTEKDMLRVLLLELFLLIEQACPSRQRKSVPQQKQVLLNHFRKLIDEHYRSLRLPKAYADLLYITPNHLNALCKDLLGKTAGDLIRDRVLLEAKRLLTNAGTTVAEIAYELNFQDNSYFNRFFRKNTGLTPDGFRKKFSITK